MIYLIAEIDKKFETLLNNNIEVLQNGVLVVDKLGDSDVESFLLVI